jgi:tol-pal system protein YbgF
MIERANAQENRVIRRLAVLALILFTAIPARAASKEITHLQFQVTALQTQLSETQRLLEESAREIKRLNEVLADQNATLNKSILDQRAQGEAVSTTLREILDRVAELKEKAIVVPGPSLVVPPVAPGTPLTDPTGSSATAGVPGTPTSASAAVAQPGNVPAPRELYSQAYADYARGNYDLAIAAFQEYIRSYPGTDFTDNAQYWIGECLYGKKAFAEAIEAWNVLFRDYPASDKLPDARVKKGMALEKLGRRSQALVEYRFVVDRFPNSPAARIAREKLNP